MLIYWLLLALPATLALAGLRGQDPVGGANFSRSQSNTLFINSFLLVIFWVFYNLISGLRLEIGGDWFTYLNMIRRIRSSHFSDALSETDIGFGMITWLMTRIGLGMPTVNALCSGILSLGIIRLARRTEHPWLAITAAVPYLLIVVGMGYLRQAGAIGFILFAVNALTRRRMLPALLYLIVATSFHLSALVVIPFVVVVYVRKLWIIFLLMLVVAILGYLGLSGTERMANIQHGYFDAEYSSNGAAVRIMMNVVPAIVFLFVQKRLPVSPIERRIWLLFSLASIGLAIVLPFSPSSTAVDRIGLLFSPIQIYVFGYLPTALNIPTRRAGLLIIPVVMYCATIQLIWLNFADTAFAWVPYKSIYSSY